MMGNNMFESFPGLSFAWKVTCIIVMSRV